LFGKFNEKKRKSFYSIIKNSRTVNGLGTLFGLAINMAISYFFLKYFHSIQGTKPPTSKRPSSGFENIGKSSPPSVKSKA